MRSAVTAVALVLLIGSSAFGQTTADRTKLYNKGRAKMWTGVGLFGVGAFVVPLTTSDHDQSKWNAPVGTALMFTGGTLFWLGFRDQRKATQPVTRFGAVVQPKNRGFIIRKEW